MIQKTSPHNPYYRNKNILIVGGSFGIGEALCRQLDKYQANLAILARSKEKIAALTDELDGNPIALKCDITQPKQLANAVQNLSQQWQHIDLIIFCAGTYQPMTIHDYQVEKAEEIIEINLLGFIRFLNAFLPQLNDKKITHFAIVSSLSGYFGLPNSLVYGASKAALSNLSESLYYEFKHKVKIQLINPGFVNTRLTAKNTFAMPGMISTQQAATAILNKLPSRQFEITFPLPFALMMKILSYMPHTIRHFLIYALTNK